MTGVQILSTGYDGALQFITRTTNVYEPTNFERLNFDLTNYEFLEFYVLSEVLGPNPVVVGLEFQTFPAVSTRLVWAQGTCGICRRKKENKEKERKREKREKKERKGERKREKIREFTFDVVLFVLF